MRGGDDLPAGRPFVGRRVELEMLRAMLSEASTGSARFVLVKGERGIGKTALLGRFLADAADVCSLYATADESETLLPYGVLEQVARSAERALPFDIPILTQTSSTAREPVALGSALLEVVRTLEHRAPIVLVVDNVDHADMPSQQALLFACRRLQSHHVLTVLTAGEESFAQVLEGLRLLEEGEGAATIRLSGLSDTDIRELCAGLGAGNVASHVAARLQEHTRGNPRHLRALLSEFGAEALQRPPEAPWPAPSAYRLSVRDRMATCPPDAQRLVAAAAVISERSPLPVILQLAGLERPLDALQAAVDAGLVKYDGGDVAFVHPLTRAAVYHGLAIAERAALHAGAATLVHGEGSALRHRAAGTAEHDEPLAADIELFATREAARGAWTSAGLLFEEAARLLPPGGRREGDMLEAVECHLMAGDLHAASSLSEAVSRFADVARSHYVLGRLASLGGRPEEAGRLLACAREVARCGSEPTLAAKIAVELSRLSLQLLCPTDAVRWAEQAMATTEQILAGHQALPHLVLGLAESGRIAEAVEAVRSSPLSAESSDHEQASYLLAGALALLYAGENEAARNYATCLVRVASRADFSFEYVDGLALLSLVEYRLGAWDEATLHSELATSIHEEASACSQALVHATATWPAAGRGEWTKAEAHVTHALRAATCPSDLALARMADAVVGRARGQHQRVIDAVAELRALGAPGAVDQCHGLWPWQEVYIDALIALGRLSDAGDALVEFEATAINRGALVTSVASRLRGSLEMAEGNYRQAEEAFCTAIGECPASPASLDRGLLHASYGTFLRRCGRRSAAATELGSARAVFACLRAHPFVERCDRELASVGRPTRRGRNARSDQLTPAEMSVARLVTEGMRNREVANELVLSEHTVEYHLKNIYTKLGIRSRAQLILRLGTDSATDSASA